MKSKKEKVVITDGIIRMKFANNNTLIFIYSRNNTILSYATGGLSCYNVKYKGKEKALPTAGKDIANHAFSQAIKN